MDNWIPLPEDAFWNREEDAFLVNGTPVVTMYDGVDGWFYLDDSEDDCS